jgi:hypothetical protein
MYTQDATCCNFNQYASWPMRTTDNDVVLHNYFAIIKWYVASGTFNILI